jgi:hypothetical protein
MKTAMTFAVILVATALILSTPLVTQAKTRTFVIVTVGGGIVVGGAFLIWRIALFSKKDGHPRENNAAKAVYVDSEEETEKLSSRPPVLVPLLTLRF